MTSPTRFTFVPAGRLDGWVERFSSAHGGCDTLTDTDDGVRLNMKDGTLAVLSPPWPDDGRPGKGPDLLHRLVSLASQERTMGIVLMRRGGYAIGVASSGKLQAHKCGGKHAQPKKNNSTLILKAAEDGSRVFSANTFEYLATGGDRELVKAVLSESVLRAYTLRPRIDPLQVGEPNLAVLSKAAADFASIRVRVTDSQ
ncbi:Vms1/Ankzf1 family peptidyl-tRNA hydrolase [Arthrobacter cryoconiti]|uniref:Vms1/Ankzf1 family peptidyl-tRNA hydrolase n=1 Tax=Arthrobacter cryoconiti TaxID=748907 RepID=A0ABV8QV48_9MICC|nr:Vms1/Ankzf1 family peptidyl-tRNA hydrolase [Arthrobacter cryoconiti]MCC9069449.1 hypothetical protein [Arthrobacter cryoconiti]